ncbi:GTPase IMAP family member 4-like [Xyrauchen texanus]|uniref:GTPase IMAP family member 4-like n=1 Tax=Xyrauchen texanus TaxID=154827 RepID=UPI00224297E1|nr:GTPase IMAP family member 4-like [Xyrauchen texanus]
MASSSEMEVHKLRSMIPKRNPKPVLTERKQAGKRSNAIFEAITGQQSPEKGDLLDKEEKSPDADRPNMKLRIVLLSTTGAAGNSILKRKALTSKFIRRRITVIGTMCRCDTEHEMRVELLHRTLILGKTDAEEKLKSECNIISVRNPSETDRSTAEGRNVSVIDTPRSTDPAVKPDLAQEMTRVFRLCSPGPHAVLFVVSLSDSFTEEDEAMIKCVEKFYGKDMADYTILVLTHSDPEEVEEFIRQDKDLNRLREPEEQQKEKTSDHVSHSTPSEQDDSNSANLMSEEENGGASLYHKDTASLDDFNEDSGPSVAVSIDLSLEDSEIQFGIVHDHYNSSLDYRRRWGS